MFFLVMTPDSSLFLKYYYTFRVNVLKSTSSSYVQNMIENMVLTSYLDKSYFVASNGGYVASIQMMSRDKLKHQVRGQFCRAT